MCVLSAVQGPGCLLRAQALGGPWLYDILASRRRRCKGERGWVEGGRRGFSDAVSPVLLLMEIRLVRVKLQSGKWRARLLRVLGTPVLDPDYILPPSLRLGLAF